MPEAEGRTLTERRVATVDCAAGSRLSNAPYAGSGAKERAGVSAFHPETAMSAANG
ncbi:hypothetical protein D3C75_1248810 [compost metagenome]